MLLVRLLPSSLRCCYLHWAVRAYSGWTRCNSITTTISQISVCETMYVIPDTALLSKGGVTRRLRQFGYFSRLVSLLGGHDMEVGQARVWLAQEGVVPMDAARHGIYPARLPSQLRLQLGGEGKAKARTSEFTRCYTAG